MILSLESARAQELQCDPSKYCCCKYGGKFCIKNSGNGTYLYGVCREEPEALYGCYIYGDGTGNYEARLLKFCGGEKGCQSLRPGVFGADYCED